MGPYPAEETIDADIINAGKKTVTVNVKGSTLDSAESVAIMIRGGHIDVSVLGIYSISFPLSPWILGPASRKLISSRRYRSAPLEILQTS